ncbi:MAG: VOC family protein [Bryobacteraceae bacterium]
MSEQSVTPYLILKSAAAAIDFYKEAFGAAEIMRHADADGRVRHAEIQIGNSKLMLVDEFPDEFPDMRSVQALGGSPVDLFLRVDDADACANRAVAAGAKITKPVADQPYGRSGGLADPFGLVWWICS